MASSLNIIYSLILHCTAGIQEICVYFMSQGSSDLVQYLSCMTSPLKTSYTVLYHCIILLVEALESALVLSEETLWS